MMVEKRTMKANRWGKKAPALCPDDMPMSDRDNAIAALMKLDCKALAEMYYNQALEKKLLVSSCNKFVRYIDWCEETYHFRSLPVSELASSKLDKIRNETCNY